MNKEVWSLRSSYKDGDPEGCGVFDSPRAMAVGLARCVHGNHQKDSRDDLVEAVALAVFDMFYHADRDEPGLQDECRDGDTVYGYEINFTFGRDELGGQGCYHVYDGRDSRRFDIDENDLDGQLWTTVTWGDGDTEDPEFTTPFPETFVSEDDAIENFYRYAVDLKKEYGEEVSEGFRGLVYAELREDGRCQVDLGDGCSVSCVLYSTPAGGVR